MPTLKEFAERDFTPFVEAKFKDKPKTREYYQNGMKNLLANDDLARLRLDAINAEDIINFVAGRREAGLKVSSINRELEVLRRMLRLALEWGKVEKILHRVPMLSGEKPKTASTSALKKLRRT